MKTSNYRDDKMELRSEKVRNLLGKMPNSLLRLGTVMTIAIFTALLLVTCFVPYPYSNGESILQHIFSNIGVDNTSHSK